MRRNRKCKVLLNVSKLNDVLSLLRNVPDFFFSYSGDVRDVFVHQRCDNVIYARLTLPFLSFKCNNKVFEDGSAKFFVRVSISFNRCGTIATPKMLCRQFSKYSWERNPPAVPSYDN